MRKKIHIGDYVHRPYSKTFWKVLDIYVDTRYGVNEEWVKIEKILERTVRPTDNPMIKEVPIRCVTLLTRDWYKDKLYTRQEGRLWDLILANEKSVNRK